MTRPNAIITSSKGAHEGSNQRLFNEIRFRSEGMSVRLRSTELTEVEAESIANRITGVFTVRTEEEYKNVINEHPELKECFISYNGQWALKERNNCNLTRELMTVYDDVSRSKAHDTIFSSAYSENEIIKFINVVAHMLPKDCLRAIDTNGHYAKNCFDYDIIMRNTTILYLAYLEHDDESVEKLFKDISNKAFRYGLISEEEKGNEISFDTVLEIVKRARERIA